VPDVSKSDNPRLHNLTMLNTQRFHFPRAPPPRPSAESAVTASAWTQPHDYCQLTASYTAADLVRAYCPETLLPPQENVQNILLSNFSAVVCHFIFDKKWILAIPRPKGNHIASAYQI